MSLLRRIFSLGKRSSVDREIEEEIRAHVAMRTEGNLAAGMSAEQAARDARLRFGNPTVVRERVESADLALGIESIWRDVRHAVLGYFKSPAFALVAIATLALGIGANTAIFQLLDAVRLRSLPIQNPKELAELKIIGGNKGFGVQNSQYAQLTLPVWQQIRQTHEPFSGVFAWKADEQLVGPMADYHRIKTLAVSGEFFSVLGVTPLQGRLIQTEDEASACTEPRAVVSYQYWQSQMGGVALTPATSVLVDGQLAQIVGVTPPQFSGLVVGDNFDIAFPLCTPPQVRAEVFDYSVMGRLKPGWNQERATAYFSSLSAGIFAATAPAGYSTEGLKTFLNYKLGVYPASGGVSGLREAYDSSLWLLLAITGLVLLIACANLANLMLARASTRQREMALRTALGASRSRLVRQMLIESGILALAGAALGVALAQIFSRILIWSLSTQDSSVHLSLTTDWRVLLFAAAIAALTCAVFGTVPALRASRSNAVGAMKAGDGRVAGGHERFSVQRLMVVTQISVSMVLLVGALLFVHSFRNLMTINPGMRESGITLVRIGFPQSHIDRANFATYKEQLLAELRNIPGVESAAATTMVPLLGSSWTHNVRVGAIQDWSHFAWVSPGYFQTMSIPIVAGRDVQPGDTSTSPRVAIVNQAFVRKFAGGVNPIGQTLRTLEEPGYPSTVYEIVGVIPDTKYNDIRGDVYYTSKGSPPMAFAPFSQFPAVAGPWMQAIVASSIPPDTLGENIKRAMHQQHPEMIVVCGNFEKMIRDGLLRERLMAILSGFFGALAALLVMVGLYGLISYLTLTRRNEIGIRIALGATRRQVVGLVMRDAALMLFAGVFLGTVLSLFAGRGASTMLFGLKPYDLATLGFAVGLLALISALASFLPARRASRLDPMAALRCE
jgi:predicted permease